VDATDGRTSRRLAFPLICLLLISLTACSPKQADNQADDEADDQPTLTISVGGQTLFAYLPLTLAERLGYFRDEGLAVRIIDLRGGSEAMAALLGGSADFVTGYYEHTIRAQAQGKQLTMVVLFDRYPGLVLMVGKKYAARVKSIKDLVGQPVGVSAPGSSTDQMLKYLISKQGLDPQSVPAVTAGTTTMIAALEQDRIWAGVTLDPTATKLERDGTAVALYDTRTEQGTIEVFGGTWPAGGIYATQEFVEKSPRVVQSVVNAAVRALAYIQSHSAEEIAAHMPESFMAGGREQYIESLKANLAMFSPDGRMPEAGPANVLKTLQLVDPNLNPANAVLSRTYTNAFVARSR
jgi:NitT/TauT family transport system substrate-binding protein